MQKLIFLIVSPFAIGRIFTTLVVTLLASQSGSWYPDALLGEVALFYAAAYFLQIWAKGGIDTSLTRALRTSEGSCERRRLMCDYLSGSIRRLLVTFAPAAIFAIFFFDYDALDLTALLIFAGTITIGNMLRISVAPGYQLGIDNTTFTCVCVLVGLAIPVPPALSALAFACALLIYFGLSTDLASLLFQRLERSRLERSNFYLASELSYFTLGLGAPIIFRLVADAEEIGVIRSIERIVITGSFVLFIINNKIFNDLTLNRTKLLGIKYYIRNYSVPCITFFLIAQVGVVLLALNGWHDNARDNPDIVIAYLLAHLVSVSCGPVSGYLNFLGHERFVFWTGIVGAAIITGALGLAAALSMVKVVVFGSALGLAVVNLLQFMQLRRRLNHACAEDRTT